MKRILTACMLPILILAVISCGDDDSDPEPVSPIVGTWDLEVISTTNLPVGFESNAVFFPPSVVGRDFNFESWMFNQDDTYLIEREDPGFNFTETGTYVFEGSSLELSPDEFDGQITDFEVSEITDANLVLSFELSGGLWPNTFLDTLTIQPSDSVLEVHVVPNVQVTRNFIFEKQDE